MSRDISSRPKRIPRLDIKTGFNHSPHVLILGAGASRACCPSGDQFGRKLPLMADFLDCLDLEGTIRKSGEVPKGNFEKIFSKIYAAGLTSIIDELDVSVRSYFGQLLLPIEPTLYDYLVLSLRPKDLIVSFNWDPLLPQAFKRWRHLGEVLPQLVFLHGNVDIGIDREKKLSGFLSDEPYPGRKLEKTPLLYPIEKKDYKSDLFVADQWQKTTDYLAEAYYVTIYGYSAPTTDVEAKALLLKAWQDNPTRTLAQFSILDVRNPKEVETSWADFLADIHGGVSTDFTFSQLMRHPRRSCEAFAFATLQQDPWHEDPFPKAKSLTELETWIKPLIAEEKTGKLAGKPHH